MASEDGLIRLSVVFKKFGLIANELLSVICQFFNVGIQSYILVDDIQTIRRNINRVMMTLVRRKVEVTYLWSVVRSRHGVGYSHNLWLLGIPNDRFGIKKVFFLFLPSHPHKYGSNALFIGVSRVRVSVRVELLPSHLPSHYPHTSGTGKYTVRVSVYRI